jgi:hypothetical protein
MTLAIWDAIYNLLLALPLLLPATVLLQLLPSQDLFIWALFFVIFLCLSLCFILVAFFLAGLRFFFTMIALVPHAERAS